MKKFLCLVALLPAVAFGGSYKAPSKIRDVLDKNPIGGQVLLGSELTYKKEHVLRAQYNAATAFFANQPSGQQSFPLLDYDGQAAVLPANAIVQSCIIDIITQPVVSPASGTLAIRNVLAGDLKAAAVVQTGYAKGVAPIACIPVGTAATSYKVTTASTTISAVLDAGSRLTAGKFNVLVKYILSE